MIGSIGAENPPDDDDDDVFSVYLRAKSEADRALTASDRAWTIVRPVFLTDDPGAGRVRVDTARLQGRVSRDDVATVLAAVLGEPRSAPLILYPSAGDDPIEDALAAVLSRQQPRASLPRGSDRSLGLSLFLPREPLQRGRKGARWQAETGKLGLRRSGDER